MQTATELVQEGTIAREFKLESSKGPVSLANYRGYKNVLLYFMREFNCMICRNHVKELAHLYSELQAEEVEVIVIGGGEPEAARRFAETFKLPFAIAADRDRTVYHHYGLDKALGVLQRSGSILLDKQGLVRYLQRSTLPNGSLDKAELLGAIAKL